MKTDSIKDHNYRKFCEGVEARGFRVFYSDIEAPALESHDVSRIQQSVGMLQEAFKWLEESGFEVPCAEGDELRRSWDEILELMDSGCDYLESILNKLLRQELLHRQELGCD
jgi:hypothetical protein